MRKAIHVFPVAVLALTLTRAGMLMAQSPVPAPPLKPGLWQTRMSQLDPAGKEVPAPEMAAFARMSPEVRAQMAERMRARGVQMPDENGVVKACITRENLDSGAWQQLATQAGCTTTYATRSNASWKWHTSCTGSLKSESDGEMAFTGSEAYRTTMRTTMTVSDKPVTSTRIMQGKWLGAACGDIKPLMPPPTGRGR